VDLLIVSKTQYSQSSLVLKHNGVIIMSTATIAIIILLVCVVLWVTELIPLATTAVMGATLMVVFGVLTLSQGFSNFASETVLVVLGMTTVGNAMFETGAARLIGSGITKIAGNNERLLVGISSLAAGALSAFMSNTGTTAIFIAILTGLAATNPNFKLKNLLMPIGITTAIGGCCTLVGSTPQLVARGIMVEHLGQDIGFFTLTPVGSILLLAAVAYFVVIGYPLGKKIWGTREEEIKHSAESVGSMAVSKDKVEPQEQYDLKKVYTIIIIFALAVTGFITGTFNSIGLVSMCAGLLAVLTGCISQKKCFQMMDWNTIAVLGGALGVAAGLSVSGAGELIAKSFIDLVGADASAFVIFASILLIATILTQFMSNTALVAMLLPIALFICKEMGFNGYAFAMGIIYAANLSYSTPVATPTTTMTLVAGYRFIDQVKYALPLNIISYFLAIFMVPLFFPLVL
jgi:sodium-dependent dicarboxylate transporter 2/3/5